MSRHVYRANCSICGVLDVVRRGWCEKHYRRWYVYGDPLSKPGKKLVRRYSKFSVADWWREFAKRMPRPLDARAIQRRTDIAEFRALLAKREPQ